MHSIKLSVLPANNAPVTLLRNGELAFVALFAGSRKAIVDLGGFDLFVGGRRSGIK
jgi:hypothetical protein